MKVVELFHKYKSIILYLFFGVTTTVINIVAYWVATDLFELNTIIGTVVAWIVAVLFAYVTNRKWVFESKAVGKKSIFTELITFFLCRVVTGVFDVVFMFIFVDLFHMNDIVIKGLSNIVVIVLNYIASKVIIFKK